MSGSQQKLLEACARGTRVAELSSRELEKSSERALCTIGVVGASGLFFVPGPSGGIDAPPVNLNSSGPESQASRGWAVGPPLVHQR